MYRRNIPFSLNHLHRTLTLVMGSLPITYRELTGVRNWYGWIVDD